MVFHWYPYHLITIAVMIISLSLLVYISGYRHKTGVKYFAGILALVFLWSLTQGLEFSVQELEHKLFFANLQYISIMLIPVLYLYLAVAFSPKGQLLEKKHYPYALLIAPLALNVLLWTDSYHGLIRQNIYLNLEGLFPTVGKTFGLIMYPFAAYNFTLALLIMFILVRCWKDKDYHFRKQAKYLFWGIFIPTGSNFLHFSGISFYNIDLTSFSFAISGLILTYGIFRHGLFDIVPIAQNKIIGEMKSGLLVYDNSLRLLELNPFAKAMLCPEEKNPSGQTAYNLFAHTPELLQAMEKRQGCRKEFAYKIGGKQYYLEIIITPIENAKKITLGWMGQIYDLTQRWQAEERLKQDRETALTMYKTAEQVSILNESAFLQAQIKPHFLFNALNIIAVLCKLEPDKARALILDLASYMRHSFDFKNLENYISLEEELEFIKAYVRIEEARFKNSLNVVYELENSEGLMLPPLLLQPLVENAIRHGIRKSAAGKTVTLRVTNNPEFYLIEVEDDGAGMSPEKLEMIRNGKEKGGVGLANIQKRLRIMYAAQLIIESDEKTGTKVTIKLPKRKGEICASRNC